MGTSDGPDIKNLVKDQHFIESINDVDQELRHLPNQWFLDMEKQSVLGDGKANSYRQQFDELIQHNKGLYFNMSIKMHFFHSHLKNFLENCGDVSDKKIERFHQDIKLLMEKRYQGRWDKRMVADYCWDLKKEKPYRHHSGKSRKMIFFFLNKLQVLYWIFGPLNPCSISGWIPVFPKPLPFWYKHIFLIENKNVYCKRRGKYSGRKNFVQEWGERTIFGLANSKASKRGCKEKSCFQPLRKRLNIALSIFIVIFPGP